MTVSPEADGVVSQLSSVGWARRQLSANFDEALPEIDTLLLALGEPLHVFLRFPFWKAIGVDRSRPRGRSGGVGLNSLHIDCVNMADPPCYVIFYCVRPDPGGGGDTIVASTVALERELSEETTRALSKANYVDGASNDLAGVGADVNPFPVLGSSWGTRFSGRLLETCNAEAERIALAELDRLLMLRAQRFILGAGEVLIMDQRKVVHGRMPLLNSPRTIDGEERLLLQAFVRSS